MRPQTKPKRNYYLILNVEKILDDCKIVHFIWFSFKIEISCTVNRTELKFCMQI